MVYMTAKDLGKEVVGKNTMHFHPVVHSSGSI